MITDFFLPAIEEYDLGNMWFQKDGATSYTTRANMALLSWRYRLATKIIGFDTIRLFCGATRETVFMHINLQILST